MAADKRFRRALVVGKFSPLHRGHMRLIEAAIDASEDVIVISYSKPEFARCGAAVRAAWLQQLFPGVRALVLDDAALAQLRTLDGTSRFTELPHNDAPDHTHRQFCAWLCWNVLGLAVDAVFTSECYGDGFAAALSAYFAARQPAATPVAHICLDLPRAVINCSGTMLRGGLVDPALFVHPVVNASLVRRVCILGGESSGKTTLARALAARLHTVWAQEYGRERWVHKHGVLSYADMLHIGLTQAAREDRLAQRASAWLVCDTSALVTAFYSRDLFDAVDPALHALTERAYDAILVCLPDFAFVQDGTRRDAHFRLRQHAHYLAELDRRALAFTVLGGSLEHRLERAVEALDQVSKPTSHPG